MQGFCLTSKKITCIKSALAFKFPGCEQGDWLIIDMPQKKSHIIIMRYVYILLLICQCSLGLNHHRQKNKIFIALTASEITLFLSRSFIFVALCIAQKGCYRPYPTKPGLGVHLAQQPRPKILGSRRGSGHLPGESSASAMFGGCIQHSKAVCG